MRRPNPIYRQLGGRVLGVQHHPGGPTGRARGWSGLPRQQQRRSYRKDRHRTRYTSSARAQCRREFTYALKETDDFVLGAMFEQVSTASFVVSLADQAGFLQECVRVTVEDNPPSRGGDVCNCPSGAGLSFPLTVSESSNHRYESRTSFKVAEPVSWVPGRS